MFLAKTEAMDTPVPGDRGECAPVLSRAMRARLFTFKPAALVDERASMATPFVASAGPNAVAAAAQREQQEVLRGETAARAALIDLLLSANRCAVECASIPLLPRPICHSDDDEGEDEEDEEEEQQQQQEHQQQQRGSKKRDGARARVPRPRALPIVKAEEGFVAARECDAVDNNAEYRWRKYGEKPSVSKSKKRCYYKCVSPGCPARVCYSSFFLCFCTASHQIMSPFCIHTENRRERHWECASVERGGA